VAPATLPPPLDQLAAGPIFVVGHPRSGTTWVYDVLTAHPEVCGVLESWLFAKGVGLLPLFDGRHWDAGRLEWEREALGQAVGLGGLLSREEMIGELRGLCARVLGHNLAPEHRFLVEKTPVHDQSMEAIAEVFPEARFIHVIRDGRDVAVSLRAANGSWLAWGAGNDMRAYGRAWVESIRHTRAAGERLGDRFFEVHYEDLKRDPVGETGRLFEFCGFPHDRRLREQVCDATTFARRYSGGEDRFRRAGRVGDWRECLGPLDVMRYWRGAGRGMLEAGYEEDLRWALRAVPHACARRVRLPRRSAEPAIAAARQPAGP
jgi:hypothetical protein